MERKIIAFVIFYQFSFLWWNWPGHKMNSYEWLSGEEKLYGVSLWIKPRDVLNSSFIGITTLHVSGSLSAHHELPKPMYG